MNNKLITVIVIIALVIIGLFLFLDKSFAPTEDGVTKGVPVPGSNVDEMVVVGEDEVTVSPENLKEFSIDVTSFSFTPSTMEVNQGDTVKITVKNLKGAHNLTIDELGIYTGTLQVGEERIVTFIAEEVGTFEYYCSIGFHRTRGMVGTLTVR